MHWSARMQEVAVQMADVARREEAAEMARAAGEEAPPLVGLDVVIEYWCMQLLAADAERRGLDHAGRDAEARRRVQDEFMSGRVQVVVATCAFGMGVHLGVEPGRSTPFRTFTITLRTLTMVSE